LQIMVKLQVNYSQGKSTERNIKQTNMSIKQTNMNSPHPKREGPRKDNVQTQLFDSLENLRLFNFTCSPKTDWIEAYGTNEGIHVC